MNGKQVRAVLTIISMSSMPAYGVDVWDAAVNDDDTIFTHTTLWQGAPPQTHDLEADPLPDVDFSRIVVRPRRSYEVLVSNVTGDTGLSAASLQRFDLNGNPLQSSAGFEDARVLRWIEPSPAISRLVGVFGNSGAGSTSIYSIQLRETTLYCPRYNNSGSQVSILIVQHASPEGTSGGLCAFEARFNNASGGETGATPLTSLFTNAMQVISTPSVTGATSGSAFVAHTCGWGGIKAKLVALEPATGFSFDTICTPREH